MLSTDTSKSNLTFGTFSDMCPFIWRDRCLEQPNDGRDNLLGVEK